MNFKIPEFTRFGELLDLYRNAKRKTMMQCALSCGKTPVYISNIRFARDLIEDEVIENLLAIFGILPDDPIRGLFRKYAEESNNIFEGTCHEDN